MSEAQNGGNVMERLTTRDANCADPKVLYGVYVKNHDYISAANRLADYEDTELTPAEIDMDHEAAEQLRHLCQGCDLGRLEELAKADKDGQLIMLPCKEGDTIHHISKVRTSHFEDDKIIIDDEGRWKIYEMPFALIHLPYIGKSYFLTREEAEKALEAMKDG